ncbi:MAG: endonuclease/exonuclease/phosphatase family protein [Bacteroidales bacterium]|nr:endonuclease/exonuclease/phosphatase family protein [Bacteroidales bacterium]
MRHLSHLIATIVNVTLAFLTILAAYSGLVNPQQWGAPAVFAMTFPYLVGAMLVLMIVDIWWYRRMVLVVVVTLFIVGRPLLAWCPLNFSPLSIDRTPYTHTFTLMTYNVFGLVDWQTDSVTPPLNPTLQAILSTDADIVVMQELRGLKKAGRKDKISPQLVDSVYARYPYHSNQTDALGIFSKYPFKSVSYDVKKMPTFEIEGYQIELPGEVKLTLVNVHLQSIGLTNSDRKLYRDMTDRLPNRTELKEVRHDLISKLTHAYRLRAEQAEEVRRVLDGIEGDLILCGDFNDIPLSYAQRTIMGADMRDAYRQAGLGLGISYHADRLYFRIDHILYRGNLQPLTMSRRTFQTSDHYPMVATFAY